MFLSLLLCAGLAAPYGFTPITVAQTQTTVVTKTVTTVVQTSNVPTEIPVDIRKEIMKQIAVGFRVNYNDAWAIADAAIRNSKRYGVPLELILSVGANESAFNKKEVSWCGAVGIMQVMPKTAAFIAKNIGVKNYDLTDIWTNIRFGTWYLKYLNQKYHDYSLAVSAYNCGPGQTDRVLAGHGKYPKETREYNTKVLATITVIQNSMPFIIAGL